MPIVVAQPDPDPPKPQPDTVRVRRVRAELAEPGAVTKDELRHALDDPIE